jgi:integrase
VRASHRLAHLPWFWLGQRGPIQLSGVDRILKRRAQRAGIEPIHAHQFRHTWADAYLSAGGGEGNLMRLAGWRSRSMLDRYGAARATVRAIEEYRRLSVGDRW